MFTTSSANAPRFQAPAVIGSRITEQTNPTPACAGARTVISSACQQTKPLVRFDGGYSRRTEKMSAGMVIRRSRTKQEGLRMRAIRFHEFGDRSVLRCDSVPEPEVGSRSVLVRVRACALNHLDIDVRQGLSRLPISLPHILGREIAGEIAALGAEVEGYRVGDRVIVSSRQNCRQCLYCRTGRDHMCVQTKRPGLEIPGGYAEYIAAPVTELIHIPPNVSFAQAAATQIAFGTAWHMLITRGELRPGEVVLINAVGSGIGSAAVQVARMAGANIIACAGSDAKLERARVYGVTDLVNYRTEDLAARVLELTDGKGVDLVFEHVGGEIFENSLKCLSPNGRMLVCGGHAREVVALDIIPFFRSEVKIVGSKAYTQQEVFNILDLVAKGRLEPVIHQILPLEEAALAHQIIEESRHFGKVILESN
jgi:NADPH:quinone reductase-like Zn-dependent oxidoreductase